MPRFLCFTLFLLAIYGGLSESEPSRRQDTSGSQAGDAIQEITVSVMVPDLGWRVSIREVFVVGRELWVISALSRGEGMAGQMMTTVTDGVSLAAPPLPIKHFIVGKTWGWENTEPYTFLSDTHAIASRLRQGQRLLSR
ncbi:MAG: hypothetical protein ETSY1_15780 [Candidatus Entotheonella factor]|uniref:Uncharacterized protein n=1 Tax=Entotheonella factor TaxID=1429438 RepID=W4LMA9_ENTF1|nr:hypothetical protein [Candidatus Entotheonella palauensis]ETW99238.1 MAG: hypothetical protein ETSY1_15780 [Candidatus Entotheonella factor]